MLEGVSISVNNKIGDELSNYGYDGLAVDVASLHSVLNEFGEYESLSRAPLHIEITEQDDPMHLDNEGYARLAKIEDGEYTKREIRLPLFPKKYMLALTDGFVDELSDDGTYINLRLLHELKHVVDYNNPELLKQSRLHRHEAYKEARRKILVARLGTAAIAGTGITQIAFGAREGELGFIAVGALTVLLARAAKGAVIHDLKHEQNITYLTNILEQRAFKVMEQAVLNEDVPKIVQLTKS